MERRFPGYLAEEFESGGSFSMWNISVWNCARHVCFAFVDSPHASKAALNAAQVNKSYAQILLDLQSLEIEYEELFQSSRTLNKISNLELITLGTSAIIPLVFKFNCYIRHC